MLSTYFRFFASALVAIVLISSCERAFAHHPPIPMHPWMPPPVVTPPPVVVPPPVVPPSVAPTPPPSSAGPAAATGGHATPWLGISVMAFVGVFFYLAICQLEEERDPEQFKLLRCPKTPDWHVAPPFTTGP